MAVAPLPRSFSPPGGNDPMLKKLVACLAMLLVWGCSAAPKAPSAEAETGNDEIVKHMRQLIESRMHESDIAGLSIVLVDDQRVVWSEGFGYADRKRRIQATPDTLYKVGSISKLLTATAVMQLADQGKFDIDHPLAEYLPEFKIRSRFAPQDEAVRGITLRQIMTHHAGLPENHLQGMLSPTPEALASLPGKMSNEYVTSSPGTVFGYSNLGYSLLGAAVERVSRRDFDTHMRDTLLRPLGMPYAGFTSDTTMESRLAQGHKAGRSEADPDIRDLPAGSLRASVGDLANFMRMMFAGGRFDGLHILDRKSIEEMLRVQNGAVALDFDCKVGLAWMLSPCGAEIVGDGIQIAAHSGATSFFRSQLLLSPAHKLGVVVLSNDANAAQVVGKLATTAMRLMVGAKAGKRPSLAEEKLPVLRRPDARPLASVPGWYATSLGALKVEARGDRLLAEFDGMNIELLDDGRGRLHPRPANLVFRWVVEKMHDDADLLPGGLHVIQVAERDVVTIRIRGQDLMLGEKIAPHPVPDAWRSAQGRYRVVSDKKEKLLIDEAILRIEDGILLAEATPVGTDRKLRLALKPISDSEAVVYGLGRGLGETIRLKQGEDDPRLHFSGYEMHRQEKLK